MIPDPNNPPNRSTLPAVGEPAPWFKGRCKTNPRFSFDSIGGRCVVLCFFGTAGDEPGRHVVNDFHANRTRFDDEDLCFFGVSIDPSDEQEGRVQDVVPGMRYFWDFDLRISRLYGAIARQVNGTDRAGSQRFTLVLDERLRVLALLPMNPPETHVVRVMDFLNQLPRIETARTASVQAPVLVAPRVFEPELCHELIRYYDQRGGEESGFMREVAGKTVGLVDYGFKRRRDCNIEDERLRHACMVCVHDRLAPEIYKAFQFAASRMERYIVACYDSSTGGYFRPHRDNTTKGTAHRRFAVSLHLNPGEYEGGHLRFPEFGRQLYAAPVGGAVVFSCSLLHEAMPVIRGKRYMFLPFLYDDEAARQRQENLRFIATESPGSA